MRNILLRPFAYLTIQHSDPIVQWVNWRLPALVAVCVAAMWGFPWLADKCGFVSPGDVNVWGDGGLISGLLDFIQSLPGFYTAALAAVATFGGRDMMKVMPGEAPKMRVLFNGKLTEPLELSRRLFLTSMFAYLTALSFLLTVAAIVGTSVAESISAMLLPSVRPWVSCLATSVFALFVMQLLTVTGWGLYYLGERMHQASVDEADQDSNS